MSAWTAEDNPLRGLPEPAIGESWYKYTTRMGIRGNRFSLDVRWLYQWDGRLWVAPPGLQPAARTFQGAIGSNWP